MLFRGTIVTRYVLFVRSALIDLGGCSRVSERPQEAPYFKTGTARTQTVQVNKMI